MGWTIPHQTGWFSRHACSAGSSTEECPGGVGGAISLAKKAAFSTPLLMDNTHCAQVGRQVMVSRASLWPQSLFLGHRRRRPSPRLDVTSYSVQSPTKKTQGRPNASYSYKASGNMEDTNTKTHKLARVRDQASSLPRSSTYANIRSSMFSGSTMFPFMSNLLDLPLRHCLHRCAAFECCLMLADFRKAAGQVFENKLLLSC